MYTTTTTDTDIPIRAWRVERDTGSIWFGQQGHNVSANCVTIAEARLLLAELTRELAAVEEAARRTWLDQQEAVDRAAMLRASVKRVSP